ncbi:MAG: transporter substrate-binding domain-containing protein [SAR324 cluster bacterium]|nr:transporter substrate-binding domain-containing protein [SAR324 cluster bacterium]
MKLKHLMLAVFTLWITPVYADTISLRADEWCPYNCSPESAKPGFMIEIAKAIFTGAGHQLDYQIQPWARAIEDTRSGKFNGIIGASRGDAEDFIFPENEQGSQTMSFFVKKGDSWTYSNLDSLKNRVLGVIKDYAYSDELDQYIETNAKNSKAVQVASGENALEINVKKILGGRIQVILEDPNVIAEYLENSNQQGALEAAGSLEKDNLYIAFGPQNPKSAQYAKLLSDGMNSLRKSGELKKILSKYGIKDWK